MPASSVSALDSWGVYAVSALALTLVLAPSLSSLLTDSRESADLRNVEGVAALIDNLRPGMKLNFSFAGGVGDAISLGGTTITCAGADHSIALETAWPLQAVVLRPSSRYAFSIDGGMVEATPAV